ncbi:CheR family methyltransferase [Algoriphagus antarcticus]|nr:CheR family methyltransferase [Algoriphagus antarcticus]
MIASPLLALEKLPEDKANYMHPPKSDLFIIAIGASAGGMDAINTLFDHTLTDAVSYVIIQHLSPNYKSFMAELLAKHSKLKIYKAESGMEVISNRVYVMPEGKYMTINGGKLILTQREESTPNSAIDIFFNSLAEDQGNKSIGIVLSGNGSDGTKGVAAIKKVGGMVIVQDPQSTEFESMPNSAISSANYDHILLPQQIPLKIVEYVNQKIWTKRYSDSISDQDESNVMELIGLIKSQTPLDFSQYKRPTIIRRVIKRMLANNCETMEDYIGLLKTNASEIDVLSKEFMIGVTNFFRDPEAFEVIQNKVIPEIVKNKLLVDPLKIWVIGCSTGEEAYSLAILVKEHLLALKKDIEVKIFASDIDKEALDKASKGFYSPKNVRDISASRLRTFFKKEGKGYQVRENIRKMLIFANHDIVQQPPYGKMDLISCRNLMIYFNPTLQKKIFSILHYCLNVEGYLFLGPSEGLGEKRDMFHEVDKKWKIFQNIEGSFTLGFNTTPTRQAEMKPGLSSTDDLDTSKYHLPDPITEIIAQSHLEESGFHAGVCIDGENKVILPFGDVNQYLLPKLFNDNLLELLPDELALTVGTSIKKVAAGHLSVAVEQIKFTENNEVRSVRILVKPIFNDSKSSKQRFIIYFGEEKMENNADKVIEVFDKNLYSNRHLTELNQELGETRKKLQQSYIALDESNYNIQSYNEELISSNEEMQSSNEELQSTNEELTTLNSQYQDKIKELADLNDDLNNYFRSNISSQIYVNKNLIIKKFSPISFKQLNIRDSDIGRPIGDISTNIKFSTLMHDIKAVIKSQENIKKNIETIHGNWYSMTIVPYIKLKEGKPDGVIITFNEITEIIKSKNIIEIANAKLIKMNEDHDTFIYSVSHDLKSPLNNINGLISIIQESNDIKDIKLIAVPLIESVSKLRETIDELSDIIQIEKGLEDYDKIDLAELVREVIASLQDRVVQSSTKIHIKLEENILFFPKKYLRSTLLNLISNAIKYRSPERENEVEIKSQKMDDVIILSVRDNGLGIAKENVGQLFTKFKRVHDLNIPVEGTGIGLYLVKRMITNAGGEIEVESKLGEGSCFKVYIKTKAPVRLES